MPLAVEVESITKHFATKMALDDVSFNIEAGEVLALLGPNGAGKTTLIRILSTLLTPDRGHARIAGLDVQGDAKKVRSLIGLAGQYASVDELLTGRENLELIGILYHLDKREYQRRAQAALERMSLTDAGDQQVKTYSGGMRRRLDLAASLIGRPPILFLDEPTTGLDPRTRNDLWALIEELVAEGSTVLLTTQYMEEAEHLANRIVVMDDGRIVAQGTADELKDHLGGNVLEVRVADRHDLEKAAALISRIVNAVPRLDFDLKQISAPIKGGAKSLIDAGRALDDEAIDVEDLSIRRPSLDDVFLSLTGHTTASPGKGTTATSGRADD